MYSIFCRVIHLFMANIAQLVRAPGCGSGGRGFETHYSPQIEFKLLSLRNHKNEIPVLQS
jgi:hypothetical protein